MSELPHWIKRRFPASGGENMEILLRSLGLHTVCESARCPNIGECFGKGTATFLILGEVCTRNCGFCAVKKGRPLPPDPEEPIRVAQAAKALALKHVVVTSVTRDDLPDGGAGHFVQVIRALRMTLPSATIEILTPDFQGREEFLEIFREDLPDVFNHNVETVPRLYPTVRPKAQYERSLFVLERFKALFPSVLTKSGLMVGLGETPEEVLEVLSDLRHAGCDIVTIGQYLRPSMKHLPVRAYVPPSWFSFYEEKAYELGFWGVASGPFVRSSYLAERFMEVK
ncbi:MAG: lipoyl synthase [Candidatus Atribacteria bacterium]|nr:lipoyl synthase [Candidatus Atribacteria bacterium]